MYVAPDPMTSGPQELPELASRAAARRTWRTVTREVAADPVNRVVFTVAALAAGLAYSVLLPFDYTLQISLANWQYFGPRYAGFTVALALGMAWVITLQVHAMRRIARSTPGRPRRGGLAGALAALVSLMPSFLCCSPIVPTAVGLLGLPVATQLGTTGTITYFFATKQNWLLAGALVLLAASGAWSVRKLARAQCLQAQCLQAQCLEDCRPAADAGPTVTAVTGQPGPPGADEPARRSSAVPEGRHPQGGIQ